MARYTLGTMRRILIAAAVAVFAPFPAIAQQAAPDQAAAPEKSLAAQIAGLGTPRSQNERTEAEGRLVEKLNTAPLPEVKANLPRLIELTESPRDEVRVLAVSALLGVALRPQIDVTGHKPGYDTSAVELLVPYLSRLTPRLSDSNGPIRATMAYILQWFAMVRPAPEALVSGLMTALKGPYSIVPAPADPQEAIRLSLAKDFSAGPGILADLLAVGYEHPPDGSSVSLQVRSDVRAAVLEFLHRPDQNDATRIATVQTFKVVNYYPDLNAELMPWLDSPNIDLRLALLSSLPGITLPEPAYEKARALVLQMAADASQPEKVRAYANDLLACWDDDTHHACSVPCGPNCVRP